MKNTKNNFGLYAIAIAIVGALWAGCPSRHCFCSQPSSPAR